MTVNPAPDSQDPMAAFDAAMAAKDKGTALGILLAQLATTPGALVLHRATARLAAAHDRRDDAVRLLADVASFAAAANQPLEAIAACHDAGILEGDAGPQLDEIAERYASGASHLVIGTTHEIPTAMAVSSLAEVVEEGDLDAGLDEAIHLCREALGAVARTGICSPIPLLSDLEKHHVRKIAEQLELQRLSTGQTVYRPADSLAGIWWLLRGRVDVGSKQTAQSVFLPGAIFGFEALLGKTAYLKATASADSELLFLPLRAVVELLEDSRFRARVEAVAARYEVHRAIGQSTFFSDLPLEDHAGFLARFVGYQIPEGTEIIRRGAPSPGLFLVTWGEVELQGRDTNGHPSHLGVGDIVGISGLTGDDASDWSVRTSTRVRALFMDVDDVPRALEDHPRAKRILEGLQTERGDG